MLKFNIVNYKFNFQASSPVLPYGLLSNVPVSAFLLLFSHFITIYLTYHSLFLTGLPWPMVVRRLSSPYR